MKDPGIETETQLVSTRLGIQLMASSLLEGIDGSALEPSRWYWLSGLS